MNINTKVDAKFCLNRGSSTPATRLGQYFKIGTPKEIKIVTVSLESIIDIFTNEVMKKYINTSIKIIVDDRFNIEQEYVDVFLKENKNVKLKKVKDIHYNMFIKQGSSNVDIMVYPFGYKVIPFYPENELKSLKGNYGFDLKIKNKKIREQMEIIFDKLWDCEKIQTFESINSFSEICHFDEEKTDKGGKEYVGLNLSICSGKISDQKVINSIKFKDVLLENCNNYMNINVDSELRIFEDCAELSFSEIPGNISVVFKDEIIKDFCIDIIKNSFKKEILEENKMNSKKDIENYINKSDLLYSYVYNYFDNENSLFLIKQATINGYGIEEGERKFNTTYNKVKKIIHSKISKNKLSSFDKHMTNYIYNILKNR